jgi:hypothetical protein
MKCFFNMLTTLSNYFDLLKNYYAAVILAYHVLNHQHFWHLVLLLCILKFKM